LDHHESLLALFMVLPLVPEAGRIAGRWMSRFEPRGLGWMDAFVVATAVIAGVPLLTRDQRLAKLLSEEAAFVAYS
jgi:predicted nucleic acid-binding protein